MLKFLIQTINGVISSDITFVLLESIDYLNWREEKSASYKLLELSELDNLDEKYFEYVPVGTIEFVHQFMRLLYGQNSIPKPLNIPNILLDESLTCRTVFNIKYNELKTAFDILGNNVFVKNGDFIKSLENGFYKEYNPFMFKGLNYMVSEVIDIESEYRCFVYKNELVGLQNYSGDFTIFPNVEKIKEIIEKFKVEAPVAYTLDVGCLKNKTFIIELHNFYSCGLYGFSDYNRYPYMLYRWFKEYKNKIINNF